MSERPAPGISVYLSGIIAGIWVALAWRNPENTYYLAPLLVGIAYPIGQRLRLGRLGRREAAWAAAAGMLNVLVATLVLLVAGKLDGEALASFWHPAVEAVVVGLTGAVAGAIVAQARMPASLVRR